MRVGILLIYSFIVLSPIWASSLKLNIVDSSGIEKSMAEVVSSLDPSSINLLGEYHSQVKIQQAQAELIDATALRFIASKDKVQVGWEFVNVEDQGKIDFLWPSFLKNIISSDELFAKLSLKNLDSYKVIFDKLKLYSSEFIALNAPRSLKKEVMDNGINSIDQNDVPAQYRDCPKSYFDKFKQSFGGHGPIDEEKLKAYFAAQCFTDHVMAEAIYDNFDQDRVPGFVILGSFHSDHYEGTGWSYQLFANHRSVNTFKFVEKNMFPQNTFDAWLKRVLAEKIADYIVVID